MDSNNESENNPVLQTARSVFGVSYLFPWQRLIVAAVLDSFVPASEEDGVGEPLRRIAVLPTGAGKSLCWMLPALMIQGISIAVFPLLSLMSDQERRLREAGLESVCLRGGQDSDERQRIWKRLETGVSKIVLANPEVLQTAAVAKRLKTLKPAFLAVDETHTVSQWGETFRPACAGMGRLVKEWQPQAVLALTATAGPHIRKRIIALLFNDERPSEALADPDRPAIRYGVLPSLSRFHTLEMLIRHEKRPAVVFGATRPSVEQAARILRFRLRDSNIRFYHAGLLATEKRYLENWFLKSDDGVLCATCAYGMGVDKSNVRTVIHLAPPGSAEAYLQESGRAARDGGNANAWLIWTPKDLLSPSSGGTCSGYQAAGQKAMLRYALSTDRCRREMLLESLGIEAEDCSGCDVCGGKVWTAPPEESAVIRFIGQHRGLFKPGQAARVLIGTLSEDIRKRGLEYSRGFGLLHGWELADAEDALAGLVHIGKLCIRRRWPYNGGICLPQKSRKIHGILKLPQGNRI